MDKLEEAIDKILSNAEPNPWTTLCIATIKLGAALAEFENAKKAYVKSRDEGK